MLATRENPFRSYVGDDGHLRWEIHESMVDNSVDWASLIAFSDRVKARRLAQSQGRVVAARSWFRAATRALASFVKRYRGSLANRNQ
jgi:hypothetical protein